MNKKVLKNIKKFTQRVKQKFEPQRIILFGSFARGNINEYSDVDVAVISDKFNLIPSEERLNILYPLTIDLYPDFHVFGFTSEEFEKGNKLTILEEIKKQGIQIQ